LNFLKGQLVFEKDFEIHFTPPFVFQPKQFLSIVIFRKKFNISGKSLLADW